MFTKSVLCLCLQRVDQKELPHYIGYLRKALKTVSNLLIGNELRGFSLKVGLCQHLCTYNPVLYPWFST